MFGLATAFASRNRWISFRIVRCCFSELSRGVVRFTTLKLELLLLLDRFFVVGCYCYCYSFEILT